MFERFFPVWTSTNNNKLQFLQLKRNVLKNKYFYEQLIKSAAITNNLYTLSTYTLHHYYLRHVKCIETVKGKLMPCNKKETEQFECFQFACSIFVTDTNPTWENRTD